MKPMLKASILLFSLVSLVLCASALSQDGNYGAPPNQHPYRIPRNQDWNFGAPQNREQDYQVPQNQDWNYAPPQNQDRNYGSSRRPLTGHFTCDNSYQVWIGTEETVETLLLQATNIKTVNILQGENLPPCDPRPGLYLYITAWSDDSIFQGLIGAFVGEETILSGDPRWRVLPSYRNKGNRQWPTQREINMVISAFRPQDWQVPAVGASNGGPPWNFKILGIPDDAHWMWYDSNKDPLPKYPTPPYVPFGSGFNHDEFLIFRIPYQDFYHERLAQAAKHS